MRQNKTPIKRNSQRQKRRRQWGRDEHRQSSCISSCHLRGSDQCLIITSTPTARWDSPARPLSPSSSPLVSLMGSPLSPHLLLLRWHNPSSSGCNVEECEPAAGNGEKTLRCELGWERNPLHGKKNKTQCVCVCVCVCWCVPTAFNVMLIQFIFNEETVSSYREAKEISGLLHSGKSIVHLFILLFELFVCLKKKNKKNTNRRDTLPR